MGSVSIGVIYINELSDLSYDKKTQELQELIELASHCLGGADDTENKYHLNNIDLETNSLIECLLEDRPQYQVNTYKSRFANVSDNRAYVRRIEVRMKTELLAVKMVKIIGEEFDRLVDRKLHILNVSNDIVKGQRSVLYAWCCVYLKHSTDMYCIPKKNVVPPIISFKEMHEKVRDLIPDGGAYEEFSTLSPKKYLSKLNIEIKKAGVYKDVRRIVKNYVPL